MHAMTQNDIPRYRANRQKEIDGVFLYRALADSEPNPQLTEVYRRLAAGEEKHAAIWDEKLKAAGAAITLMTGRSVVYSGFRQVLVGLAAAALTFGIGHLLGVSLGG